MGRQRQVALRLRPQDVAQRMRVRSGLRSGPSADFPERSDGKAGAKSKGIFLWPQGCLARVRIRSDPSTTAAGWRAANEGTMRPPLRTQGVGDGVAVSVAVGEEEGVGLGVEVNVGDGVGVSVAVGGGTVGVGVGG